MENENVYLNPETLTDKQKAKFVLNAVERYCYDHLRNLETHLQKAERVVLDEFTHNLTHAAHAPEATSSTGQTLSLMPSANPHQEWPLVTARMGK